MRAEVRRRVHRLHHGRRRPGWRPAPGRWRPCPRYAGSRAVRRGSTASTVTRPSGQVRTDHPVAGARQRAGSRGRGGQHGAAEAGPDRPSAASTVQTPRSTRTPGPRSVGTGHGHRTRAPATVSQPTDARSNGHGSPSPRCVRADGTSDPRRAPTVCGGAGPPKVQFRAGAAGYRRRRGPRPSPGDRSTTMSTYTGNVTPGGPPDVRELTALTITKLSVGPMDNNAYLLRCPRHRRAGADRRGQRGRPAAGAGRRRRACRTVVTTHRHQDHWVALEEVAEATGARSLVHAADAEGLPVPPTPSTTATRSAVGDCALEVIHLVGHTPGSIALLYRDPAGDAAPVHRRLLFPGGVGNTDGDAGRVRLPDRRRRAQAVRPAAGRDLVLPRPRQRHHAGRRAPVAAGVARPRLVTPATPAHPRGAVGPPATRRTPRAGAGAARLASASTRLGGPSRPSRPETPLSPAGARPTVVVAPVTAGGTTARERFPHRAWRTLRRVASGGRGSDSRRPPSPSAAGHVAVDKSTVGSLRPRWSAPCRPGERRTGDDGPTPVQPDPTHPRPRTGDAGFGSPPRAARAGGLVLGPPGSRREVTVRPRNGLRKNIELVRDGDPRRRSGACAWSAPGCPEFPVAVCPIRPLR